MEQVGKLDACVQIPDWFEDLRLKTSVRIQMGYNVVHATVGTQHIKPGMNKILCHPSALFFGIGEKFSDYNTMRNVMRQR